MADDDELGGDETPELLGDLLPLQRNAAVHALPDWLLQSYVREVNRADGGFTFSITLLLGGLVVSGVLTAASEWMNELAHEIEAKVGEEKGRGVTVALRTVGSEYQMANALPENELGSGPAYLHLRDAVVMQGGVLFANGTRMRCRLASVDGWFMGQLS